MAVCFVWGLMGTATLSLTVRSERSVVVVEASLRGDGGTGLRGRAGAMLTPGGGIAATAFSSSTLPRNRDTGESNFLLWRRGRNSQLLVQNAEILIATNCHEDGKPNLLRFPLRGLRSIFGFREIVKNRS